MSIEKYSNYITLHEQKSKTIGIRSNQESKQSDTKYGMNYDTGRGSKALDTAIKHIKAKGYKTNHDGSESDIGKHTKHDSPDVTLHYARGDDMPHAYTVHAAGNASDDSDLQVKSLKIKD